MPVKTILITFCTLSLFTVSFAQQTTQVSKKLTRKVTEVYQVLQTNPQIKHGLYQARYNKNMALASGLYAGNKRIGMWHFFDYLGNIVQNYNYDQNVLTFESPDDAVSGFQYIFDKKVKATDTLTKPVKIGGRYYGYINYLNLFKRPADVEYGNADYISATIELLVSPGGHLADYTIHVMGAYYRDDLNVNIDLLSDDDKIFIPATLNNEPVASRIIVRCAIDFEGQPGTSVGNIKPFFLSGA